MTTYTSHYPPALLIYVGVVEPGGVTLAGDAAPGGISLASAAGTIVGKGKAQVFVSGLYVTSAIVSALYDVVGSARMTVADSQVHNLTLNDSYLWTITESDSAVWSMTVGDT